MLEAANGMLRLAAANSGRADNKSAICNGFGDGPEFLSAGEQRLSADGGTRFAEGKFVGVHDAKMEQAKVTHGASGGANVQRIARLDEDDAQLVELGEQRQGSEFTAEERLRSKEVKTRQGSISEYPAYQDLDTRKTRLRRTRWTPIKR